MNAARVLAVAFVAVALSLFVYVRAPGRHPGIESHYHYRLGAEIAGGDWAPNPGAHLPWGAMAEAYPVDHHWGLHALIAPFAALGDAMGDHEAALKAASVGFVLLSVLGLYLALRLAGAPWPELLCFAPWAFGTLPWRMLQLRGGGPMAVALVLLYWTVFAARRPGLAFVLGYVAMASYNGSFLAAPVLVAGCVTAVGVAWLRGDGVPRRVVLAGAAALSGLATALVIGPYGTDAARFLVFHLTVSFGDPAGYYAAAAHEFDPFTWALLGHFPEYGVAALGVLALSALVLIRRRTISLQAAAFIGMSAALAVLSARSHRLVEYAIPVALVAAGLAGAEAWRAARPGVQKGAVAVVSLALALMVGRQVGATVDIVRRASPTAAFEGLAPRLSASDDVLVNLYQGDFSLLLWAAPEARLAQGLNHYFTSHDPEVKRAIEVLRDGGPDGAMIGALRALRRRGGTLFVQRPHRRSGLRPFVRFAEARPDLLTEIWRHSEDFARAWRPTSALDRVGP